MANSLLAHIVKNLPAIRETGFHPCVGKICWRRESTPVVLPGEFHGQRSLAGYIPWSRKESDTTEYLTHNPETMSFGKGQVEQRKLLRPNPGLLGTFWREGQHKMLKPPSLFLLASQGWS